MPTKKSKSILLSSCNIETKRIPQKKRKSFFSDIISNKILSDEYLNRIIEKIKKKSDLGESLESYCHYHKTDKDKHDFLDKFLNATGIHHLHCSLVMENTDKMHRSDNLLFIFFNEENAYFIDILPHNDWHKPIHLYNIILNNWNFLLREFGSARSAPLSTDAEIWESIQNNISPILKLKDEKCYSLLGHITTNGLSDRTVSDYDRILDSFPNK